MSATSVASYIWMAKPKNSEKLYCINEYSFGRRRAWGRVNHGRRAVGSHPNQFGRIPPLAVKRSLNQLGVPGRVQAFLRPSAQGTERAVFRMHELQGERTQVGQRLTGNRPAGEFLAQVPHRPASGGHFSFVHRRADRLRGEAGVLQPHLDENGARGIVRAEHAGVGIAIA